MLMGCGPPWTPRPRMPSNGAMSSWAAEVSFPASSHRKPKRTSSTPARTSAGAYRWNEAAQSWIPITDWLGPNDMGLLGIDALALDPSAPGRVYMLAGTDYWNQGKTMILAFRRLRRNVRHHQRHRPVQDPWERLWAAKRRTARRGSRISPRVLFCGTRSNGLWKSADRGSTWAQVASFTKPASGDGVGFVLFDKTRAAGGPTQRIFAGTLNTGGNLFVSDDAGNTWQAIALPALSKQVMPQRAVLTPKGRYLYMTVANGSGPGFGNGTTISRGALLRYDTDAKTWENISPREFPRRSAQSGTARADPIRTPTWAASAASPWTPRIRTASSRRRSTPWKPQIWEFPASRPGATRCS